MNRPWGDGFSRAVAAVLFLAASAYIGAGLFSGLERGAETVSVRAVSVTDSVKLQGLAVRRERLIRSPGGGRVTAGEGLRVPKGGQLALEDGRPLPADSSGLFFSDTDGLESLGPEALEGLDVKGLEALLSLEGRPEGDALGRLVLGCDWYYAALAPQEAALPEPGPCALLLDGRRLSARLLSVSPPEDGQVALVLRLTEDDGELLRLRKAEAELILAEYSGLELPEEALVRSDGGAFVYTISAGAVERKAVTLLYDDDKSAVAARSREPEALHEGDRLLLTYGEPIEEKNLS